MAIHDSLVTKQYFLRTAAPNLSPFQTRKIYIITFIWWTHFHPITKIWNKSYQIFMTGVFKTGIFWCFFKVVPAPYEGGPSMYGSLSWATWKNIRISALWWWMACQGRPSVKDATTKKHNPMGFFTKNTTVIQWFFEALVDTVTGKNSNLWMLKLNFDQNLGQKNIFLNGNLLIRRHGSTKLPPTWFFPIDFATCKTTFFLRKKSNSLTSVANHPSFGTCCPDIRKDIQRVSYRVDENILMGRTDPIFGTAEDGPVCQSCDGHVMSMWSDEQLLTTCWKKEHRKLVFYLSFKIPTVQVCL